MNLIYKLKLDVTSQLKQRLSSNISESCKEDEESDSGLEGYIIAIIVIACVVVVAVLVVGAVCLVKKYKLSK